MFNSSKCLNKTINSVINQSYKNWELILIDDQSTDDTLEKAKKLKKKNKKIHLIVNKINSGPAISRINGIKKAKGHFICFLDSDDYFLKNKLYDQLNFMTKNNCNLSFTNCYHLKSSILKRKFKIPDELNYSILSNHNYIITSTVMINRKVFNIKDLKNVGYDDYNLWLNITKRGYNFFYLNKELSVYRHSVGSISSNKFKALVWVLKIYFIHQKNNIFKSLFLVFNNGIRSIYKKMTYQKIKKA